MIILGIKFDTPVNFVVCWTKDGKDTGGTGLGMRIAQHHNIPIFNLYFDEHKQRVMKILPNLKLFNDKDDLHGYQIW